MSLIRVARIIVGGVAVLLVAGLLFLLWRLYAWIYLNRSYSRIKPQTAGQAPAPENAYRPPAFVYDDRTHEFFMKGASAKS